MLRLVRQALAEPLPPPSPNAADEVTTHVKVLQEALRGCTEQKQLVKTQIEDRVPAIWTGEAAERATARATALRHTLERAEEVFAEAMMALSAFSRSIEYTRDIDRDGRAYLEQAEYTLAAIHSAGLVDQITENDENNALREEAHNAAKLGITRMLEAAQHLRNESQVLERTFGELSSRAHAARIADQMRMSLVSDVDPLVIADAAVPGGPHDANLILTAAAARRVHDRLDQMAFNDQERFRGMLEYCDSSQERAYVLQALAAGYKLDQIRDFIVKIHSHAKDPMWLQQHLTPIAEDSGPDKFNSHRPVMFGGQEWTQGGDPTCVAMSTVMARAKVDPLYALELTTGGHPGDPAYDNPDAFAHRLHDEQHRIYDDGRNWLQDLMGKRGEGMTDGQAVDAANEQVGSHTGAHYDQVTVNSTGDRRNVLPDVEKAVDQGLPVTFGVQDSRIGHEMAIVGRKGDMLEVYNPWGYTVWVSEDDFIHNRMNLIEDGVPATVHAVNVPRN